MTELQAGGGIFACRYYTELCKVRGHRPAIGVLATVVGRPTPDRAILDIGQKSISEYRTPPVLPDHPGCRVLGLSAEHATVEVGPGDGPRHRRQGPGDPRLQRFHVRPARPGAGPPPGPGRGELGPLGTRDAAVASAPGRSRPLSLLVSSCKHLTECFLPSLSLRGWAPPVPGLLSLLGPIYRVGAGRSQERWPGVPPGRACFASGILSRNEAGFSF